MGRLSAGGSVSGGGRAHHLTRLDLKIRRSLDLLADASSLTSTVA